jgi:hypothetical protein
MPLLRESMLSNLDMSGYQEIETPVKANAPTPNANLEPGLNAYLRCPLPPVWTTPPDSLRQFYQKDVVPQWRLFNPPTLQANSGSVTINNFATSSSSGGGGSTSSIVVSQTSIKTPSLGPNKKFVSSLTLAKTFQILQVSANASCRIQLYGTQAEQNGDLYRVIDQPPPAGSAQNIITDVVLDTSPFQWSWQDRCGSNNESPRTTTVYITVTNIQSASMTFNITLSFVPLGN